MGTVRKACLAFVRKYSESAGILERFILMEDLV